MDYLFEVGGAGGAVGVGVLRCGGGVLVRRMIVRGMVAFHSLDEHSSDSSQRVTGDM